ncbi:aminoglycoside phosphotransferase family protein [Terrabacter sp. AAH1]
MEQVFNPTHPERTVARRRVDGRDVVVKRYARGGADEVRAAMEALWASPFGASRPSPAMPGPVGRPVAEASRDELWMSFVAGRQMATRTNLGDTLSRLDDVARLLADLNRSGVVVPRRRTAARLLLSLRRKRDAVGGRLAAHVESVVARLELSMPQDDPLVVNHGDFSPRNLIVSGHGLVLIDFDRLQMADPVHDVAYFGAWLWATDRVLGRDGSWRPGDELAREHAAELDELGGLDELEAGRDDDERRHALAFHRSVGLVRIATSWTWMRDHPDVAAGVLDEAQRLASALPALHPRASA